LEFSIILYFFNTYLFLLISSDFPTFNSFEITVPGNSVRKISIAPISIQTVPVGSNLNTVIIEKKGIRLESDQLVTVHATSGDFPGSDTYSIMPARCLGTRYRAASSALTMNNFNNIITVVAYVDKTTITINNVNYTLNAFETASIASYNSMSGMLITGDIPFAVVSGCTAGITGPFDVGNHEAEMVRQTSTWKLAYAALPFSYIITTPHPTFYLLVSDTAGTIIRYPSNVLLLNAGEFAIINETASGQISASNPIQVIQYGQSAGPSFSNFGDAFFLPIPTESQLTNEVIYFFPCGAFTGTGGPPVTHMVRIFTLVNNVGQIYIDTILVSALLYKVVPQTSIYYYEMGISADPHSVSANNPDAIYAVMTYSYSYSAGCGYVASAKI